MTELTQFTTKKRRKDVVSLRDGTTLFGEAVVNGPVVQLTEYHNHFRQSRQRIIPLSDVKDILGGTVISGPVVQLTESTFHGRMKRNRIVPLDNYSEY